MGRMVMGVLVVGAWLALAGSAAALCTCGDRDGCGSAASCVGEIPGHECGKGRTCKIRVGTGTDLTCCCGCSKGVGPTGCNYGELGEVQLAAEVGCGSEKLASLAEKVSTATTARLAEADAACQAEKNATKKANAGRRQLNRLRKKVDRFEAKGQIEPACATGARALIDQVLGNVDAVEAGAAPGGGGSTTTTTSSTLPGGPSCSATFTPFADPFEVDFILGCFAAGTDYQGFALQMNGGRQVTNYLAPTGFSCSIGTRTTADDSLLCIGNFNVDTQVTGGRIRTSPAPVSGMDASLFVMVGSSSYGPFPTTGP